MSERYCIYFKDEEIISKINPMKNRSEYVERAVKFYMENKDVIKNYASDITALRKLLTNKDK